MVAQQVTKSEFEAEIDGRANMTHQFETDGNYEYETYFSRRGRQIGFIAWTGGHARYYLMVPEDLNEIEED